jgi:hypothetical protein
MAMGDKIECPVGGVVETTFQLDFKKAQVAELPDAANFRFVVFSMDGNVGGKTESGFFVRPNSVEVTADDQKVVVRWTFANDPKKFGPDFFKAGEEWQLKASYQPTDSSSGLAPDRTFVLGTVKLTGPK